MIVSLKNDSKYIYDNCRNLVIYPRFDLARSLLILDSFCRYSVSAESKFIIQMSASMNSCEKLNQLSCLCMCDNTLILYDI